MPVPPPTAEPSPLPRRVAWFAPWRWSRRAKWLGALLLVVMYVEAVVPLATLNRWFMFSPAPRPYLLDVANDAAAYVFAPIEWAVSKSTYVNWFYETQFAALHDFVSWVLGQSKLNQDI